MNAPSDTSPRPVSAGLLLHGKDVLIGAATLEAGRGGIASVMRMTARVLQQLGASTHAVSYLDANHQLADGSSVAGADGSKLGFAAKVGWTSLGCGSFAYDSAGIARAHPRWRSNARCIVWMHGIEAWEGMAPHNRRVLERAKLVLVNSNYTLARHQRIHGPLPNAKVCLLATEDADEPAARAELGEPPAVLVLSRLDASEAYKGQAELIASWPAVRQNVPDARLIIAGSGTGLEALRETARRSPASAQIEFTGFVPSDRIADLWRQASVFAMPSRGEGFGLVYIEAMRQGIPVVASIHDAGREVNLHGQTGFNVDLDDPRDLACTLTTLLRDAHLRRTLGMNARQIWRERYTFDAFAARLAPLLVAALSNGNVAP